MEWDDDDGFGNLWGLYYNCPNMEFILREKAALHNRFDATATAMTISLPKTSLTLGILKSSATRSTIGPQYKKEAALAHGDHGLSHHVATLQDALRKHWEDILHLLHTGSNSEQPAIPQKMLQKIQEANMLSMTKVTYLLLMLEGRNYPHAN